MNDDQAFKWITNKNQYIYDVNKFEKDGYSDFQFISSWDTNFESWKVQKKIPIKIIRYEDLLNQTYKVVSEVIAFINQTTDNKDKINKNKIKNAVNSSSFSKLQDKEKNEGFSEAPIAKGGGKKIPFFNLGPNNKWEKLIDEKIVKEIEIKFNEEMKELEYISP